MKFFQLSRKKRKQQYIKVKNTQRIYGLNHVPLYICEDGKPNWNNILFVDTKTKNVFKGTINTVGLGISEELIQLYASTGHINLGFIELQEMIRKHIEVNPLIGTESVEIFHNYKFGIGFVMFIDADYLTTENVSVAVDRFLNNGFNGYFPVKVSKGDPAFEWLDVKYSSGVW